jgi:hypothetical protein
MPSRVLTPNQKYRQSEFIQAIEHLDPDAKPSNPTLDELRKILVQLVATATETPPKAVNRYNCVRLVAVALGVSAPHRMLVA